MNLYTYICVHVCVCLYMIEYICAYICKYMHMYMSVCIYMYACIYILILHLLDNVQHTAACNQLQSRDILRDSNIFIL